MAINSLICCLPQQRNSKWSRLYFHSINAVQSCFKTTAVLQLVLSFAQLLLQSKVAEGEMHREAEQCSASLPSSDRPPNNSIILLQKQESDQTLCQKVFLPDHLHHECAPPRQCLHGHDGQIPSSLLPPGAAQVQGSSKLVSALAVAKMLCIITGHSMVLSEL